MSALAKELNYNGTFEEVYTSTHPKVIKWTKFFHNVIPDTKIFENFQENLPRNFSVAHIVSTAWHSFSEYMPWFLCRAASQMSSNLGRHYVIQTAFEELGMRDYRNIHAGLFWNAAISIGVETPYETILLEDSGIKKSLKYLSKKLLSYSCDMQIFGILLGLEIPALENIETVYGSMAYNDSVAEILNKNIFFVLHRQVEVEHVRLTVSNFLRFQNSVKDKENFIAGFMDGIAFWEFFWKEVKKCIKMH